MSLVGVFTWWREATVGTRLFTWAKGEEVGQDRYGNRYFKEKGRDMRDARRWVIYDGDIEATKVPPVWHAWLHKTVDEVPGPDTGPTASWQIEHSVNLSGTAEAYRPPGHPAMGGKRPAAGGDYEPWTPA
jgi:NADH:ubiquinone oxidoreductase subunit